MTHNDDIEADPDAKTWSAKFPGMLAKKIQEQVMEYGFLNISEYIREACRDKSMYLEVRAHKQILDYLVAAGKLDVGDVKEAIYAITTGQI